MPYLHAWCSEKRLPFEVIYASAACSEFECFNSVMSPRMRKLIHNACLKILSSNVLRIPWLIRELTHSNSNMRHLRLTSKGSLFWDTLYMIENTWRQYYTKIILRVV